MASQLPPLTQSSVGSPELRARNVMRPRDRELYQRLHDGLEYHHRQARPLPGIQDPAAQEVFVEQILDSVHRVQYVTRLNDMQLSECRLTPTDGRFDPLKGA